MEEVVRESVREYLQAELIDVKISGNDYCGCPCCGTNVEASVLYWKIIGVKLKACKFHIYYSEDDNRVYYIKLDRKISPEEFEEWNKWSQNDLIMDAMNAMQTEKWAKIEQTGEAWDKNREVY